MMCVYMYYADYNDCMDMGCGPFMSFKSLLWSKKGNGAVYKRMGYFLLVMS